MADIKSMFSKMANGQDGGGGGDAPAPSKAQKSGKQTIEQTYQKKTQLEHILLRPDTYIGSVEKATEIMWVYDSESDTMIQKKLEYVPGLYKIFDEILVNAADNKQKDKNMDCIKIEINQEENRISVWNNGQGIPVAMHQEENMFVPTMIFGHLLTSSNYNDEEEKVTGGRNGYGAKLCNIFSTKFIVETASKEYKKQFKQTWGSNMTKTSEPKIKEFIGEDFTKITFHPDLQKFKMDKLDDDIVALMSRRAYDVAASTRGVKVFLNGRRLPIKCFKDYVDLYIKGKEYMGSNLKVVYDQPHERWEIAVTVSSDEAFRQISFVNSIATTKGGRHVDYVTDMVVKQLQEVIKKKNKGGTEIKPHQIKNHMWVFINCLIANPTFDSQTKEFMTLQAKKFGSKITLSEKFVTNVQKSGIVEEVLSWAKQKEQRELEKKGAGKKTSTLKGIPKLVDANEAGKANSYKCTLILTEGDSAKTLAVSGLGVIGRDYYGVFPLRGKVLNVREATHKQIMENAEINNLIKIIGLVYKRKYTSQKDLRTLRYGKVMIMTDQDQDGSHIKGLLINFIHHNWPELLQLDFLEEFITPIVKARKKNEELSFYSLPEFEEWKAATANHHTYQIKYYKGLGTSTSKEAKEYFTNMERHRICFKYQGPEDDDHIVLAFSKKKIEERKEWLTNFMEDSKRRKELGLPEKYLYTKTTKRISFKEFVNLELVLFSNADNIRSIPSLVDGFKPGQRKVLFTCIKRNDKKEVKVAQLAGSVAEHSAYHHGEVSLCATIVNLAQNFVGSNNINLLEPRGQFGTRLLGGKDSASPRYIFTKMSPLTRMLFHPHDDPLLKHEYDDNLKIEPVWYAPIIPMVLVNGADGIGTGWMTKIPNYNPRELVQCIKALLNDEEPPVLHPWYKNFKGTIEYCGDNRYCVSGEIAILGNKFEVTELPVGTWTEVYKENTLEPMLHGNDKVKASLQEYREYNTDTTIRFVISPMADKNADFRREGLHKAFKLQSLISTTSMCCFDELNCLRKFDSVMDILKEFYKLRLTLYKKRKDYLAGMLEAEAKKLSNQARFILEKCNGTVTVENKKRKLIVEELVKRKYDPDPILQWKKQVETESDDKSSDQEENTQEYNEDDGDSTANSKTAKSDADSEKSSGFNYILGMSMWMLTEERKNELLKQRDIKLAELKTLESKTPAMLWLEDLDAFLLKLDEVEEKERADESGVKKNAKEKMPDFIVLGKGKAKKKIAHQETMPSPAAERVMPLVSEEIKKKVQAAAKIRENKFKKIKKEPAEIEADDLFDAMTNQKSLSDRLGLSEERPQKGRKKKATDGLKQTKLNFAKKEMNGSPKKKGRKQKFDDSDDDQANSDSDEEFAVSVPTATVKERTTARRNAVKVTKYTISDDEESDDNDDDILVDNVAVMNESIRPAVVMSDDDDSDSEKRPPPPLESSEDLFDSLIGARKDQKSEAESAAVTNVFGRKVATIASDSDSAAETKTKAASKPKAAAKPRKPRAKKRKSTDSDNESAQKKKKSRKKSGNSSSSDVDFNIEDHSTSPVQVQRSRTGRRAVPKKIYTVSDSD